MIEALGAGLFVAAVFGGSAMLIRMGMRQGVAVFVAFFLAIAALGAALYAASEYERASIRQKKPVSPCNFYNCS